MKIINIVLLVLAFSSGLTVVGVKNQSTEYFIALNKAQKTKVELEADYARLKLAQAGLSSHQRIVAVAVQNRLKPPAAANTQIIETQ